MTFFDILETLGICIGIYFGVLFFPWIFTIFRKKIEKNENIVLESPVPSESKKYSYHINLGTELVINQEDLDVALIINQENLDEELKIELEKRNKLFNKSDPNLTGKIELVEDLLKISKRHIRKAIQKNELKNNLKILKNNPEDLDSLFSIMRYYYNNKEYENCIKAANKIYKMDNENLEALRLMAKSHKNLGNLEMSLKISLEILEHTPEDLETLYILTRLFFATGDYHSCIKHSEQILIIDESNINAMRLIAKSYGKLEQGPASIYAYSKIIEKYPEDIDTLIAISRINYNLKDYETCIKNLQNVLKIDNINVNAKQLFIRVIRVFYNEGKYKKCITTAKKYLKIDDENIDVMRFIAKSNNNLGNEQDTLINYIHILEKHPQDINTIIIIISSYYKLKNYEEVLIYCDKLLLIESENKTGILFKSRALVKLEEFQQAILFWKKLLKLEEDNIEALVELGENLNKLGDYKNAVLYLEKGLEIQSRNIRAIKALASIYDHLNLDEKALKYYILSCKHNPKVLSNWEKRINLLYRMNNEKKAKDCLNEIITLLGDTLEGNLVAISVAISWYWEEEATELINRSKLKWGEEVEHHVIQLWEEHWKK
tara:strand:+ start:400 stop:2211 length:1812 start_codon:yes stop_codon:yes gene_type:complete